MPRILYPFCAAYATARILFSTRCCRLDNAPEKRARPAALLSIARRSGKAANFASQQVGKGNTRRIFLEWRHDRAEAPHLSHHLPDSVFTIPIFSPPGVSFSCVAFWPSRNLSNSFRSWLPSRRLGMITCLYLSNKAVASGSFSASILSGVEMKRASQSRSRRLVTPRRSGPNLVTVANRMAGRAVRSEDVAAFVA
jgi:hypothetical protein